MNELLKEYIRLIQEGNLEQNLVSRNTTGEDLLIHVYDSLVMVDYEQRLNMNEKLVIDLGSGQGLPAIPLAIMVPGSKFVLVESDLKKSLFLSQTVEKLNLKNVTVIRARIEDLGQETQYREGYDVVTVRGLAEMSVLLEWGLPLLKVGGTLVAWKGPNLDHELEISHNAMSTLGGVLVTVEKYLLEDKERALAFVEKTGPTPSKYPRRGGIAKKRPL
ncbi:MAG: 16S rRNA (guanine(527)-N(7))-methyltransferase RsmG [Ignavibacteriales bacterium]